MTRQLHSGVHAQEKHEHPLEVSALPVHSGMIYNIQDMETT